MSTSGEKSGAGILREGDMRLEVVLLPVADVERAKEFYTGLGWRLDADVAGEGFHLVQLTPPGSGCSVQFGRNVTSAQPGSLQDTYLAVTDIEAARRGLVAKGVEVGEAFHCSTGIMCRFQTQGDAERAPGRSVEPASYGTFARFEDPDGNGWLLQEVTSRLPGRVEQTVASFDSVAELASALRRAEAAHGEHEKRTGEADANWPDWYAEYILREQTGDKLPS